MTSRREFLGTAAISAVGIPLVGAAGVDRVFERIAPRSFIDLQRPPDAVFVQTATGDLALARGGERWTRDDVSVTTTPRSGAVHVVLAAPATSVRRIHLRWRGPLSDVRLVLGDAWERGYGDLEWRGWAVDRVMP